jgi:hypothetical protein
VERQLEDIFLVDSCINMLFHSIHRRSFAVLFGSFWTRIRMVRPIIVQYQLLVLCSSPIYGHVHEVRVELTQNLIV